MKAYRSNMLGYTSIVWAETRSKAKAATVFSARDAGFHYSYKELFCGVTAKRAPEYDLKPKWARQGVCYGEDYVSECCK